MTPAILFDIYGTLLQLTDRGPPPYSVLLIHSGLSPAQCRQMVAQIMTRELRDIEAAAAMIRQTHPKAHLPQDRLQRAQARLTEQVASVALIPGARRVLARLRQQGRRLALVSNLATPFKEPVCDLGLEVLVDAVVYSCDRGVAKPDPAIFQAALDALKVSAGDATMVGDKVVDDVEGAESAGLRAVLVDPDEMPGPGVIGDLRELLERR